MPFSLAATVDQTAREIPDAVWVTTPLSSDTTQIVWHDITWRQLSEAINTMACWMEKTLGPARKDEPVAYMGINDIRYPIVICASLKVGYKTLLTSPRNSHEGNTSLLEKTACSKFLFSKEFSGTAHNLQRDLNDTTVAEVPSVHTLLDNPSPSTPYSYYDRKATTTTTTVITNNTGAQEPPQQMHPTETVLIVHSSGTTGLPKPIPLRAGVLDVIARLRDEDMPVPKGRRNVLDKFCSTERLASMVPLFHMFGVVLFVCRSVYWRMPTVLLPPGAPPTAELMLTTMEKTRPTAIVGVPSVLEDMARSEVGMGLLGGLEAVFYGGAPLAKATGDKIAKVTRLVNAIGTTEVFHLPSMLARDPADWEYFEWNPHAGIEMERVEGGDGDGGLAELVVVRREEDTEKGFQFVFCNYPELQEWRTKDLFERHARKEGLWRYVGRVDDIIVLKNGEKLNPVSFEKAVEGHKMVKGALMVGSGRFQTGLLIELHAGHGGKDAEALVEELWSWIERANEQYPAHAQVWRSMVAFAVNDRPFVRTPKGSVMRRQTCQLYAREIDALYAEDVATAELAGARRGSVGKMSVVEMVRKAVCSIFKIERVQDVDNANFFALGADSLRVLQITQTLNRRLAKVRNAPRCTPRTVYENPTISKLSAVLEAVASPAPADPTPAVAREQRMSSLIRRYSRFPQPPAKVTPRSPSEPAAVLIIGSTGTLGPYLLSQLLSSSHIGPIYALNRTATLQKHLDAFSQRDLDAARLPSVTFLTGDITSPSLGLPDTVYAQLQSSIDMLLLNAWPVNFNATLEQFEPALAYTQACAHLAITSARKAHVVLPPSVASVMNYPSLLPGHERNSVQIPEEFDGDNSMPGAQGHGESKHVASAILSAASARTGMPVTILRAGQIAGPVRGSGVWNVREWLPSLVSSSVALGKIPASLGPWLDHVDWVPVDLAAEVILELVVSKLEESFYGGGVDCFNLSNPRAGEWKDLIGVVQRVAAQRGQEVQVVGLDEWVGALTAVDASEAERFPAVKLVEFFAWIQAQERCRFLTGRAEKRSRVLREMGAVDGRLMERWCRGWGL